MPEDETKINPYRFVKNGRRIEGLEKKYTHERFSALSGSVEAEIISLTPLTIGGRRDPYACDYVDEREIKKSFIHYPENGHPFIPGSSLKGVVSTIYRILAGSDYCVKTVFGDIKEGGRGENLKGHIFFSDAALDLRISPKQTHEANKLPSVTTILNSPKKHHRAFYQNENSTKLYHHQSRIDSQFSLKRQGPLGRNGRINHHVETSIFPLPANCRFTFSVDFKNIDQLQLAVFLRSLFLGQGLCHKIGGGKPLGAGSVHIRPMRMTICPDKAAFYRGANNRKIFIDTECLIEIEKYCQQIEIPKDLHEMLIWREDDQNEYAYPSREWFQKNSQVHLRSIADVYTTKIQPSAAQENIDKRWLKLQEIGMDRDKQLEKEAEKKRKKQRWNDLSPMDKAMELWLNANCDLNILYYPEKLDKETLDLDYRDFQIKMLKYLQESMKDKCSKWKKTYLKEKRKAEKNNKPLKKGGPWPKICELAEKLGYKGWD